MVDIPHTSDIPDMQGETIGGKYKVLRLIGTGGMGTVWEGLHEALGQKVAIKFIKPTFASHPDARRRFEIEARAAARLKTRHAVQVYDFGVTEGGLPYIVMEYLEGKSLSDLLMERGPLTGREVGIIIGQASHALEKAHAAGIVHRDLKPDNIFLATNADDVTPEFPYSVKLVDFGIAKIVQDQTMHVGAGAGAPMGGPTQEGAVVGTPNFMSPEQLTVGGAPNAHTDIWSLGACAFTAMTARIPFEGEVLGDIVLKVCVAPLPVPSQLNAQTPSGFDAWFARACNRDPEKRFTTAQEAGEAIEPAEQPVDPGRRGGAVPAEAARPGVQQRRHRGAYRHVATNGAPRGPRARADPHGRRGGGDRVALRRPRYGCAGPELEHHRGRRAAAQHGDDRGKATFCSGRRRRRGRRQGPLRARLVRCRTLGGPTSLARPRDGTT